MRNIAARNQIVEDNLGLVYKLAERYRASALPYEDLIQEGNLGLMRAAEDFDPELGNRFSTYASWWIRSYMQRAIYAERVVHVPEWALIQLANVRRRIAAIQTEAGMEPELDEVIEEVRGDYQLKVIRALFVFGLFEVSMDEPRRSSDVRRFPTTLHDVLADDRSEKVIDAWILLRSIMEALWQLHPRYCQVLWMRWGLCDGIPMTLKEVGKAIGLTRQAVHQIESCAMVDLDLVLNGKRVRRRQMYARRNKRRKRA